jgi:hypothetical protein
MLHQKCFNDQIIKEQFQNKKNHWMITFDENINKYVLYLNEKEVTTSKSVPELQAKMK